MVLNEPYRSHFELVKTKALARSYIWWPGLDKDIENSIKNCLQSQKLQSSAKKSSLISWVPNDSVWICGSLQEITTAFTVSTLRELFSRYGIVDTLVSDNGTQFTSHDFQTILSLNGIKHILTAPGRQLMVKLRTLLKH
ncbi:uncharacterized protein K02A2.6-like [Stomoxys calcitrans]|uniref:uncharacterized protein K02A2.6-like n=1 Tax=Stomoxys calcitrans TaxID=35570 RepID=UPI0027E3516B|nr:uncharacterized protein K02A2.6-like [Stomoxys calcitrans]